MKSKKNTAASNIQKSSKAVLCRIEKEFIWDDRVHELMADYEYIEPGPLLEQAWCFYFNMTGIKYKYNPDPICIDGNSGYEFPPTFYFEEIDTYGSVLPTPFNSVQINTVKEAVEITNIPVLCLAGLPRMILHRLYASKSGKVIEKAAYPVYEKKRKKFLEIYDGKIIQENLCAVDHTNFLISHFCNKIVISYD